MRISGRQVARQSIWSQSGQFWLGAFMVAETPVSVIVMLLPDMTRAALLDWMLLSTPALLLTVGILILSGILVGIAAYRLGWGE